ncbi:MAG TPA: hypothetical protein DEF05_02960, partial [Erwinia sp.]|nr:hypothetical protein [Erwinia sp.]
SIGGPANAAGFIDSGKNAHKIKIQHGHLYRDYLLTKIKIIYLNYFTLLYILPANFDKLRILLHI